MCRSAVERGNKFGTLNEERQRAVLEWLRRDGRVVVVDLAEPYNTPQVTIRQDLDAPHLKGLIHRAHGWALPARDGALVDPTLREKEKLHRKEKLQIAAGLG
jgi:DeoR family fructose operon transcriptional repressor